jgi:hypothetical protein
MRSDVYPEGEYEAPWDDEEIDEGPDMPDIEQPDWDRVPDYWEGERY